MNQTPFFFELSGEHPTLPLAEAVSTCHAEAPSFSVEASGPGYAIVRFPGERLQAIGGRLALTHRIGEHLGSFSLEGLLEHAPEVLLPEGSIAVRVKRQGESFPDIDCNRLASKLGGLMASGRKVDLVRPDLEVRIVLSDRLHLFLTRYAVDRTSFEQRKVAERPFFSPISLHPRYARALVNLTRVKRGERLLDPFCGTGGILIEAASIGVRAVGSDISPEMVEGCKDNMRHFGLEWDEVEVADVGSIDEVFDDVTAVATDPPYGRSASTRREPVQDLYARALPAISKILAPGSGAGVVLPRPCPSSHENLVLRESHHQRVHRSLTRHYCLFTRSAR